MVVRDVLISPTTTLAELDRMVRELGVQLTISPSGNGWVHVMIFGGGVGRSAASRDLASALQIAVDLWTGERDRLAPPVIVPIHP